MSAFDSNEGKLVGGGGGGGSSSGGKSTSGKKNPSKTTVSI